MDDIWKMIYMQTVLAIPYDLEVKLFYQQDYADFDNIGGCTILFIHLLILCQQYNIAIIIFHYNHNSC